MQRRWKTLFSLILITFFLSVVLNFGSNSVLSFLPLTLSFMLLLFVILIGVLFDIIGVAATAGNEAPFHAMASNKVSGAKQAIWLVRNADGVSTFCNDLVGDVAGTLSGAIGVAVIFRIAGSSPELSEALTSTLMVALVAALTVGGKALGKNYAISNSTKILMMTGWVLNSLEKIGVKFEPNSVKNKKK
ncbi:MAG: hypothetical protein QM401_06170 [Bacillota bacterium]|nr:hypothetical protein [Bacillota bacterium]HHU60406.1 hypothetical protein [Natronincola sp.]